jgi:hypothetical protein
MMMRQKNDSTVISINTKDTSCVAAENKKKISIGGIRGVSANQLERAKCSAVVCRSIVVVAVSRVGKLDRTFGVWGRAGILNPPFVS